jgi:transcriptional regulator with XRE-family HTH domain
MIKREESICGERIRERRKALFMTQAELAERINTDANTISRWERGEMKPGVDYLSKIALALDTSITHLIGQAPNPEIDSRGMRGVVYSSEGAVLTEFFIPQHLKKKYLSLEKPVALTPETKGYISFEYSNGKSKILLSVPRDISKEMFSHMVSESIEKIDGKIYSEKESPLLSKSVINSVNSEFSEAVDQ